MKNNTMVLKQLLISILFVGVGFKISATTYLSSASNGAAWTSTTTLDAYQNTSNNFVGKSSSVAYNPSDGDTMQGLFMFKNGFSSWSSGNLTWNARGVIDEVFTIPSAGTLTLSSNLNLGSTTSLSTPGAFAIYGGAADPGKSIFLEGGRVSLSQACTTNHYLTINGLGNRFIVARGGCFTDVGGSGNLTLSNMNLVTLNTTTTLCIEKNLVLENVVLDAGVSSALMTSANTLYIRGSVRFEGFGKRIKVNAGAISIAANSSLYVGPGVILTNIEAITMADQTSVLYLDGCQFYTGNDDDAVLATTITLRKGTLILGNNTQIFNKNYGPLAPVNTDMTKALTLGDGSDSANDVNVVVLGGAYVTVDGCIKYNHA